MSNNVLVLGSGAREHAIAWKLSASPVVNKVYVSPGNACKYSLPANQSLKTVEDVRNFCYENEISLVVIGPEKEICDGWADALIDVCPVFAPSQKCAQLEASKSFAKEFMIANRLPTAEFQTFYDVQSANKFIASINWEKIVIKEDGLCAGKGVSIAETKMEAMCKIEEIFNVNVKSVVVIEQFLIGYEVSAMCFTDGSTISRLPLSQDHKRALEGDLGENTGGMGAIAPIVVPEIMENEITKLLEITINAIKQQQNSAYKGILYAGLMITKDGPKILEYNCRFGDPETEVLLRLLDSDLFEAMQACCNGTLANCPIKWAKKHVIGIVMASYGYPRAITTGIPITEIPSDTNEIVTFYAGLKRNNANELVNSGGRVLCVTCIDSSPFNAKSKCLNAIEAINFPNKQFRRDIGHFVLSPSRESLSYSASGVNVDEGNRFVDDIKEFCRLTLTPGTEQIGGFGALVDLKAAGFNQPELVIGMDGVGTKLEIATQTNTFHTLGYDLVGMCVNDVLCHASKPVAFLDYYVTGKLNRIQAVSVVKSISSACIEAECALIGGETAEMPGVYNVNQWDIAGCCIGCREADWPKLPQTEKMKSGDILLGLASNGMHSNGFSLVRKILSSNGLKLQNQCPWDTSTTLGAELLRPTKIYVKSLLKLSIFGHINAMAHITGGGIVENLPRCLPDTLSAVIDCRSWKLSPLFQWLKNAGAITPNEMLKTFNCGIGMILVIAKEAVETIKQSLKETCTEFYEIGHLVHREVKGPKVRFMNIDALFHYSFDSTFVQHPRTNMAIMISGTGSNMVELIRQSWKPNSHYFVSVVISNKEATKGVEYAQLLGVETFVVPSQGKTREEFEAVVSKELQERNVDFICLAGFMRLLTRDFISQWQNRIINIHPSLLPSFKGAHAVELALKAGVKISGCTVHYVVEDVDAGEILAQETVNVESNDTLESLHAKIQVKEHLLFPRVAEDVARRISQQKFN